ncbi:MAG: Uma2 family endonuclease [Leptolyngbyaceae cyanobacterium SM2_5_2]|nr:Uma2 family endonuclease [Leptolyngbyaceae cyanobacterium SM2_5_2]
MPLVNLVKIPVQTIDLSPGSHLLIEDVTWEQYEALLEDLGEDRHMPRINYCNGTLELMAPLPAHERPHRIIAYIVTAILDAQDRAWEDFGATTFKKPKRAGLEPDTCFYIQNAERARALMRMDMASDPPPDLAIEADVTSKTTLDAYATLKVPEVWIYDNGKLAIYLLDNGDYRRSTESAVFPYLPVTELIPKLLAQAFATGTSTMLRSLRQQLQAGELDW